MPTEYCLNIFEEGDQRFEASIRKEVLFNEAGQPVNWVLYPEELGPHIKKYEDPGPVIIHGKAEKMYFISVWLTSFYAMQNV